MLHGGSSVPCKKQRRRQTREEQANVEVAAVLKTVRTNQCRVGSTPTSSAIFGDVVQR